MRDYEFYYTQDGSVGLYSYADNDVYHSKFGALSEAWDKFVLPSGIAEKLNTVPNIKILDVCYGIGYNTKAIMTYIINSNQKYLSEKNILKKFFKIFKKKKLSNKFHNIETIHTNNTINENEELLVNTETIEDEIVSHIQIDCLDINSELVKISPLLKTIITPQEMFSRIVPRIFDCFDTYWKIKRFLAKHFTMPSTKDRINISELLDLKFGDNYKFVDKEYKIHDFVNYILINNLSKHYSNNYINDDIKKLLKDKRIRRYFNKNTINYAKFKQSFRYKLMDKLNLCTFLHNIYYDHLSKRYKKASFNSANDLFSINFFVDDARKSILNINDH
ncbi:MAG: hypothetical protein MJ231_02040, partial [bacterium]|nr:hypothetical protein [bacterium]